MPNDIKKVKRSFFKKAPKRLKVTERKFVFYIHWQNLTQINFGISFDLMSPNIEIHLPFMFIKIGWEGLNIYEYINE